ncbi:MAG: NAD(P)-dependent oxidoreductase [Patescibacteria group bacterium]
MPSNKPVILGTGLSGMIGSRLVEMFGSEFEFINLDLATGVDITQVESVSAILKKYPSTTVIHLAAFTDVSKAYTETDNKDGLVYKVNVLGTKNIAAACKKYSHYLIHISTDFIFNGANPPTTGYTEIDQPHPIEWYGQTKLWAEEEVVKSGCRYVICRTAFPYRAKFDLKPDLVRNIIINLTNNILHPMFSDQIITPTFIDDLCEVFKIFIAKQPTGIYHCVGSTALSPFELAQKIAQIFEITTEIKPGSFKEFLITDPRPRQQFLRVSNAKLFQDFNYKMKTIDEALQLVKTQL